MKKVLLSVLVFAMTLGIFGYSTSVSVLAEEKTISQNECIDDNDLINNDSSVFIELDSLSNNDVEQLIHQSAQAIDELMSTVFVTDIDGNLISVDVDRLESEYGVTPESTELRKLVNQNSRSSEYSVMNQGIGYHTGRFASCFIKQIARSFGLSTALFIGHGELVNLVGKKAYYQAVQKMAQIAVNKLGKKAALKLVEFATPAGWALSAGKVALWTYRCTVEYGQWA
ncbi:hypothetical protein [Erysipelothrix anatis]|uniref:hypothetical protein n=1 Tax=Erysipelothrix anatis TaxID=2683713 RepID=UPI0013593BB9|nr:hypothetical protein [Erysipelothrix anatis]